ncbi:MAG: AAA family ATPase [Nitrososphaerota archaeon]|nr:AAA family ATPase [Nitrososphaerota archaeon]MDG7005726.1 AAA family ATPase [Nitrososphaerota archaeon]
MSSPARIPTGVEGLDAMSEGGFIRGDMHLIAGAPGTGKTILAATFAYNAVTVLHERVVYATFEESTEYMERNMKKLGIDLAAAEKTGNLKVIDLDALKGKELESNISLLISAVKETKSTILIIDSLTALLLATESKFELRAFMKSVYKTLKGAEVTTIMTISQTPGAGFGIEGFVADSVTLLENVVDKDQFKTRMMILKMRGTENSKRYHTVTFLPRMTVSKY